MTARSKTRPVAVEFHDDLTITVRADLTPPEPGVIAEVTFRRERGRLVAKDLPIVRSADPTEPMLDWNNKPDSARERWLRRRKISASALEKRLRAHLELDPELQPRVKPDPGVVDPKGRAHRALLEETRKRRAQQLPTLTEKQERELLGIVDKSSRLTRGDNLLRSWLPVETQKATKAGSPRRHATGLNDADAIHLLARYLVLCQGPRPRGGYRRAVADEFGGTPDDVDRVLRDTFDAGLWNKHGQGRAGGTLTERGRRAVQDLPNADSTPPRI